MRSLIPRPWAVPGIVTPVLDAARPLRTRRAVDPLVRSATTFVARRPLWGAAIGVATAALALADQDEASAALVAEQLLAARAAGSSVLVATHDEVVIDAADVLIRLS